MRPADLHAAAANNACGDTKKAGPKAGLPAGQPAPPLGSLFRSTGSAVDAPVSRVKGWLGFRAFGVFEELLQPNDGAIHILFRQYVRRQES